MSELSVAKFADIVEREFERFMELTSAHWEEIAQHKHLMKLDVNVPRYLQLEKEGRLHVVVLRKSGVMIGYSFHFVAKGHPHYRHLHYAEDDVHYIDPPHRGSGAHEAMRRFALKTLKERGVQFVTARTKFGHSHDTVLRAIGFEPMDMTYGLDLANWQGELDDGVPF